MRRRYSFLVSLALCLGVGLAPAAAAEEPAKPAVVRGTDTHVEWHLRESLSGGPGTLVFRYGTRDDAPLFCDWNGDGRKTPGMVRTRFGTAHDRLEWHLRNRLAGGPADVTFVYGRIGWRVCGDWNGDGRQTPGVVYERADGRFEWHLRNRLAGGPADVSFAYGRVPEPVNQEVPPFWVLAGDWNGDGRDTPGLVVEREDGRPRWMLRNASAGGPADLDFVYGGPWDIPVVGDWDGDGRDTAGVVRIPERDHIRWFLRNAHAGGAADHAFTYGRDPDFPLVWR